MSNKYRNKTDAELAFIIRDAAEAALNMRLLGNATAESKYLDQVNDASSEQYRRRITTRAASKAGGAA